MVYIKLLVFPLLAAISMVSADVSSISECPKLAPRKVGPKDVTDLRVDDIKVIGALGDSLIAGFGMLGINYGPGGSGVLNTTFFLEARGRSYAMGGDNGTTTIANFIKHYSPKVKGASISSHFASKCNADDCVYPRAFGYPHEDRLNAAQSSAISYNLKREVEYLIDEMKLKLNETVFKNSWKLITIQIGSNDQCSACKNAANEKYVSPEMYGENVDKALKTIKNNIPNVVINLFGNFKVSKIFELTADRDDYCHYNEILQNKKECECSNTKEGLEAMDTASEEYNKQLEKISAKYKGKAGGSFAVMYSPAPIDITTFPIDAISNIDCFHPNVKGHEWFAKNFWNQMFTPKKNKPAKMDFVENLKIRCPTELDRFPIVV